MRVLYFDCFSGISGDMTLGALLDLGLDHNAFLHELDKLNVTGYSVDIKKIVKNGISGTDVNVILEDGEHEAGHSHEHHHEHSHHQEHEDNHGGSHEHINCQEHKHNHEHEHTHNHEHEHSHDHEQGHEHGHGHDHEHDKHQHGHSHSQPERNLMDIENIINMSSLKPRVKAMSTKIFREIARAEAKVHGKNIDEVHFHEVGALDSIVDIIGACICIDMLGVERIFASELHEGKGFVKCAHGLLPVPVPAVLEMLCNSNIPLITEDTPFELVTPTGIAILKMTSSGFGKMPPLSIERTGYGMGKRETGRFNALRAVVGTLYQQDSIPNDEISILETNIDNMSPEILGYTMERLLESGALDVYFTPIYMKKCRPSVMLTVLATCSDEKKLSDIIFKETSTLGVRLSRSSRYCMNRELVKVNTQYGDVRVKVASMGDIMKFAPEYEDCKSIAVKTGLPIIKVYELVNEKYRQEGSNIVVQ
jgi:pyridinium-3,5-bisthiocarboxylic acid mononucleotide nickel chelatase